MDVLTPIVVAVVVVMATGVQAWIGKGRFDTLERRFDAVDRRFDAVDRRFDAVQSDIQEVRSEMAILRSDLTHVALAVGAKPHPRTG